MAIQAVRKSTGVGTPTVRGSSDSIEIELDEDGNSVEGLFEEYLFDGQTVYEGHFEYSEEDPWSGAILESEGTLEFREDSGLLFIEVENGSPDVERIVDELSENINGTFNIESIAPQREQIWEFIGSVRTIIRVDIIKDGYVGSLDEFHMTVEEAKKENYPVKRADILFDYNGREIDVRLHDQELIINQEGDDSKEYVMQKYENTFHFY